MSKALSVGVDIGGTFTDIIVSCDGAMIVEKLPSSPGDPRDAVIKGVAPLLASLGGSLDEFRHGTTVATNAILEGKGVRTAFLVTEGFEDMLELRRQNRDEIYDLAQGARPPLIEEELIFPVKERVLASGEVHLALDPEHARSLGKELGKSSAEAVAVSLLFSFLNPEHERILAEALKEEGLAVSLSHEIIPAIGEYERSSATVFNAMLSPIMQSYLDGLQRDLQPRSFSIMSSSATAMSLEEAKAAAIETVLSGPAAGVSGAVSIAAQEGFDNLITFDMGGTSTDVSLVERGRAKLTREAEIAGRPLGVECVDIHTIGAGGGSIAYLDEAEVLRVGPESAGALPGPACYGKGGERPSVSDANLVLRRLRADCFLQGNMALKPALAQSAVQGLAQRLGLSIEATALGIVEVAESNMERALRKISLERGHDPRCFTLFAFGGAGPLHACALARGLSIPSVLIPPDPGALCAAGALSADELKVFRRSLSITKPPSSPSLKEALDGLPKLEEPWSEESYAVIRYRGESQGLELPFYDSLQDLEQRFRKEHLRRFGFDHGNEDIEIPSVLKRYRKKSPKLPQRSLDPAGPQGSPASWELVLSDGPREVPFRWRASLAEGEVLFGPLLIAEHTSTILVEPGFVLKVLSNASLLLERTEAQ